MPGAARPDDREDARIAVEPERRRLEQLALAAEEVGRGVGQVDGSGVRSGGNSGRAELEQLRRGVEVLEPVASEILQRLVLDERSGRGREDHLAAVRERGDPRAAMDVDPDVALGGHGRRAGVQAHPHGDRARRERLLAATAAATAPVGGRKGDEERVALGVDLDATLGGERIAKDAAVLGERLGVALRRRAAAAGAWSPRCR